MSNKKQLTMAFVWDFTVTPLQLHSWEDGLREALSLMAEKYEWKIRVVTGDNPTEIYKEVEKINPDYVLAWGSLDRPSFAGLRTVAPNATLGLCFAGGPTSHPHADNFDIIFVENEVYEKAFAAQGYNVKRAFGTNTNLFIPMPIKKHWIGIYPAAFAKWKRHELFAESLGHDGLAIGKFIPEESEQVQVCIDNGVTVLPEVPYRVVPYFYNQSRVAVITASAAGGSQRAVLEAMACDVPTVVMKDSDKCSEYILDSGIGEVSEPSAEAIGESVAKILANKPKGMRDYVMSKYSADHYCDALHIGLTTLK